MYGYGPYGMMGNGGEWGSMGWMMLAGGLFWLFILLLVVGAFVWLIRGPGRTGQFLGQEQRGPGLEILEERYARGEINRDEYLQKKRDMLGRGAPN